MRKKSGVLLASLTLAIASMFGTQSAMAQETSCPKAGSCKWKMATGWAGGPLMDIGAKAFAERLKQLSGGRMEVQVFPGGALGNALKVSETVKNGIADMGHLWMGYDWGKDTTTVLFGGYAGSFDTERMLHWLYEGGGVQLQREYRQKEFGVVSMPLFIRTAEVFLHSRKPVKTMQDLQGLKLRTAGAWIEMSAAMGAAPVTTPGGEIYAALERGVIDATEWGTLSENISPGFSKVAKYLILPGVHQPTAPFEMVINQRVWDKLTKADQDLIELTAKLVTYESWLKIGQGDAKALEFYRQQGNEVIDLEPEVQYAARTTGLKWAEKQAEKSQWFARVMKSQQEFEKLWSDASRYRNVKVEGAK
jgi:TRAP-type mannitol/chloroaromatic compound transport system substrate-binding protein